MLEPPERVSAAGRFHLFCQMDQDRSGKVIFIELRDMVRSSVNGLALKPAQLPEARLKSLWRALDDDNSGYITAKEFGHFMKKGAPEDTGMSWWERRTAMHRSEARRRRPFIRTGSRGTLAVLRRLFSRLAHRRPAGTSRGLRRRRISRR